MKLALVALVVLVVLVAGCKKNPDSDRVKRLAQVQGFVATESDGNLIVATTKNGVQRVGPAGTSTLAPTHLAELLVDGTAIYGFDENFEKVLSIPKKGGASTVLAQTKSGESLRQDVANLYWIESRGSEHPIMTVPKAGGTPRVHGAKPDLAAGGSAGQLAADESGVYATMGLSKGPMALWKVPSSGAPTKLADLGMLSVKALVVGTSSLFLASDAGTRVSFTKIAKAGGPLVPLGESPGSLSNGIAVNGDVLLACVSVGQQAPDHPLPEEIVRVEAGKPIATVFAFTGACEKNLVVNSDSVVFSGLYFPPVRKPELQVGVFRVALR